MKQGGFTLVEVMVATVLLSMIILSILSVLIGSYRVAAKARYADHARYVIKAMADQFLTQQSTDTSGNTLTLFQVTTDPNSGDANYGGLMPLGNGMTWTNSDNTPGWTSGDGYSFFYVKLGDTSGAPVVATVTRTVQYVYPTSGQPTLLTQNSAGGYLLEGDFTITYPFLGTTMSQTITAIRSIP